MLQPPKVPLFYDHAVSQSSPLEPGFQALLNCVSICLHLNSTHSTHSQAHSLTFFQVDSILFLVLLKLSFEAD